MNLIEDLLHGATELGACNKTDGVDSFEKLVALFNSPQGREFCAKHSFPSREQWSQIRNKWSTSERHSLGVFIDEALPIWAHNNPELVVAVGDSTHVDVRIWGAEKMHRIILLHGATAAISASNYAVFEINAGENCGFSVGKDKTCQEL